MIVLPCLYANSILPCGLVRLIEAGRCDVGASAHFDAAHPSMIALCPTRCFIARNYPRRPEPTEADFPQTYRFEAGLPARSSGRAPGSESSR
jgi:hypothetical protein